MFSLSKALKSPLWCPIHASLSSLAEGQCQDPSRRLDTLWTFMGRRRGGWKEEGEWGLLGSSRRTCCVNQHIFFGDPLTGLHGGHYHQSSFYKWRIWGLAKRPWTSDTPSWDSDLKSMPLVQQHTTLEFKLHRADWLTIQRACNEWAIWNTFPENSQGFRTFVCHVHTCVLKCASYRRREAIKVKREWTPLRKETGR